MLLRKLSKILSNFIIFLIKVYKKFISPLSPNTCIYYPTCSDYSIQALQRYGFFKGLMKSGWRIIRCNPWHEGGYDPLK